MNKEVNNMKKRVLMLAMLAAFVLSFGASAWAGDSTFGTGLMILNNKVGAEYATVYKVTERAGKEIFIRVRAKIAEATNDTENEYSTDATKLKWTVTQSPTETGGTNPIEGLTISSVAGTTTREYALDDVSGPATLTATLSGIIRASGTVTVTVALMKDATTDANGTDAGSRTTTCNVEFSTTDYEETLNPNFPLLEGESFQTIDIDTDTLDPRDPESVMWNGLFPPFSPIGFATGSSDVGKLKPKVTWPKPNDFKPGVSTDTVVATVTGPVEGINVYIAGKDAVKLFGLAKGAADIPLTSANVAQYNIPFRVVSINSADNKATGAKSDKESKTTVTIAFNGGNYALKGYPITVSAWNKNNSSKPAAKAVKLNVGDPKSKVLPEWMTKVVSKEVTATEATYTAWNEAWDAQDGSEELSILDVGIEDYTYTYEAGSEVSGASLSDFGQTTDQGSSNSPHYFYFKGNDDHNAGYYALKGDTKVYEATQDGTPSSWYRKFETWKTIGKKDKPEVSAKVNPDNANDYTEFYGKFYISGDAPLLITAKGGQKVGTSDVVSLAQASFDYLGRMTERGYVTIDGTPKEKAKETKEAVTLTVTNPSTNKKGTAKVTVIGKTQPVFEKAGTFKYAPTDTDTHKRYATKRVEAGKVPSVKFKAKGTKTIEYYLGAYRYDMNDDDEYELMPDGEGVYDYLTYYVHGDDDEYDAFEDYDVEDEYDELAEAFNAELENKLKGLKLSFDKKKGAVALLNKSDKNTLPTLNATSTDFQSLDIVVTAFNGVGVDQAWSHVAITGAKPAVSDKEANVTGTVKVGDVIPFKLKAGKTDATATTAGVNIKATEASASKVKASALGLKLVTWDSMDVLASRDYTFAAGAPISGYNAAKSKIVDGSVAEVKDGETVTGYKAGSDGLKLLSGDKWVKSADARYKNQGLLQVVDPAAIAKLSSDKTANKGQTIDLALENLGATNKGKIKVIIKNDVKDGGDPTKPVVAAPVAVAGRPSTVQTAAAKNSGGSYEAYTGTEAEAEADEPKLAFGAPRTVANLTAAQKAFLAEKGYTVIAVLPEVTADADGQAEIAVELIEDAPKGAKLVYIPFPKNAEETDDDKIADFYDEAGEAIENVPAGQNITVAPWFRAGVTYEPVIAAEDK